jgi:hypothetical protein
VVVSSFGIKNKRAQTTALMIFVFWKMGFHHHREFVAGRQEQYCLRVSQAPAELPCFLAVSAPAGGFMV